MAFAFTQKLLKRFMLFPHRSAATSQVVVAIVYEMEIK
jgi:hypothetical protein